MCIIAYFFGILYSEWSSTSWNCQKLLSIMLLKYIFIMCSQLGIIAIFFAINIIDFQTNNNSSIGIYNLCIFSFI